MTEQGRGAAAEVHGIYGALYTFAPQPDTADKLFGVIRHLLLRRSAAEKTAICALAVTERYMQIKSDRIHSDSFMWKNPLFITKMLYKGVRQELAFLPQIWKVYEKT